MKDIEVNGAHITDESAEILKQWQVKTEPVSACYIRVIEETIALQLVREAREGEGAAETRGTDV